MPAGTGVCVVKILLARVASQRFLEIQPMLALQHADALQRQERRVALVHVVDGGLQAHGLQRAQCRRRPARISWRMRVSVSPP